jgi:hypothetical protein
MTHICPACGLAWECACTDAVIEQHREELGGHEIEIACSEKCGQQLVALLTFLSRYANYAR